MMEGGFIHNAAGNLKKKCCEQRRDRNGVLEICVIYAVRLELFWGKCCRAGGGGGGGMGSWCGWGGSPTDPNTIELFQKKKERNVDLKIAAAGKQEMVLGRTLSRPPTPYYDDNFSCFITAMYRVTGN